MSEAASHNRPISASDVRKAIKYLAHMRRRREKLLETLPEDSPAMPWVGLERDALEVAERILTEGREEVFRGIAQRLALRPPNGVQLPGTPQPVHTGPSGTEYL